LIVYVAGGGKFIGRDGRAVDLPHQEIDLPEDVLPSKEKELERDLEFITISDSK
jgi:hypothetical protein